MSTLLAPVLQRLRDLARHTELFGREEATALGEIADRLQRFSAGCDDLRTWLSNEIELEASADRLHLLLRRSYTGRGGELVELTGELLIVVRIVRAHVVAERFPSLSDSVMEGPASALLALLPSHEPTPIEHATE
jgi:hypothetical protein